MIVISAFAFENYIDFFDSTFQEKRDIYYVVRTHESNLSSVQGPHTSAPLSSLLRTHIEDRGIVSMASSPIEEMVYAESHLSSASVRYVDEYFFDLFPLGLNSGDYYVDNLAENQGLISKNLALSLFGTLDVAGKVVVTGTNYEVRIVGVMDSPSRPSHITSSIPLLSTDIVLPLAALDEVHILPASTYQDENWNTIIYHTYVGEVSNRTLDQEYVNTVLQQLASDNVPEFPDRIITYTLQPISSLARQSLNLAFQNYDVSKFLNFIAFCVFLIATINFLNINFATLSLRAQETGINKILGASRIQLVIQHFYCSFLIVFSSAITSILVASVVLWNLSIIEMTDVGHFLLMDSKLWLLLMVSSAVVAIAACVYPPFFYDQFQLISLLRPISLKQENSYLREISVSAQFFICSLLLIFGLTVSNQNSFLNSQVTEYSENLLLVPLLPNMSESEAMNLAQKISDHSFIHSASFIGSKPWAKEVTQIDVSRNEYYNPSTIEIATQSVSTGFEDVLEIPVINGITSSEYFARNQGNPNNDYPGPAPILIDADTAKSLGWRFPSEAVGTDVYIHKFDDYLQSYSASKRRVIGILGSDSYSLYSYKNFDIEGRAYLIENEEYNNLVVRTKEDKRVDGIQSLKEILNSSCAYCSSSPENFGNLFHNSSLHLFVLGNVILALSSVGFIVASIGLLGNTIYLRNMKAKEFGIRKVLGAESYALFVPFLYSISRPVLLSGLMAWPIGYFASIKYLDLFVMQTNLTIIPFVISILLNSILSLIIVLVQNWKLLKSYPAPILRSVYSA